MPRAGLEIQHEIQQFLYDEARLLDEGEFHAWLELFADDIQYWMPTRYNRTRRERDQELSRPDEIAFFDDDKTSLGQRVRRLDSGLAWAEDPPSRTRHLVTNVQIDTRDDGELDVRSNFVLYRSRLETDENFFIGVREDRLRKTSAGWRIARRKVILDQNVILAKNISVFF